MPFLAGFLLRFYLLLMTVLVVLVVCFTLYCDSVLEMALCRELHYNISSNFQRVLQITGELTGLPVPVV